MMQRDQDWERRLTTLERELEQIKERNERVEANKSWEVSALRAASIAVLTYVITAVVFSVIGARNPLLNAFVPTIGYLLSTLSLSLMRRFVTKG